MAHASSNILIGFEYDKEFETNDSMIIWFIQKFYQHKIDFEGIETKEDFVDILLVTGLFHLVDNKLVIGKVVSDPGRVTVETIKVLQFSNMIETYDSVIEYKDFFQSNSIINCYHGTWFVELNEEFE